MTAADGLARMYLARGWPLLVCHPRSKEPLGALVPHGVHSSTTDPERIAYWLRQCPDANWAVATGAPGPQALDIDNQAAAPAGVLHAASQAPRTASARSGAAFFQGTDAGTVVLPFGELRGRGSYQMLPPSIHPSGKEYVWLQEPRGRLPAVPRLVAAGKRTAGAGQQAPVDTVSPGGMYVHLVDLAVRLARAGLTHADVIERVLVVEFDAVRVAGADYGAADAGRRDTRRIAEWASGSNIAERERSGARSRALMLGNAGLGGRS
jgi:hypothetical protein